VATTSQKGAMIAPGLEAKFMEDLFRSYWWLLFPMAWFIIVGWRAWLRHLRRRDTVDLIKSYAASGKDIPAGLIDKLSRRSEG
jgi:hypothetical protein